VDDSDSEDAYGGVKSMDLHIEPWQTLLLLEDDAASKAQEISRALAPVSPRFVILRRPRGENHADWQIGHVKSDRGGEVRVERVGRSSA
jgi:hypothetical protein